MKRVKRTVEQYFNFMNHRKNNDSCFYHDLKLFNLPSEIGKVLQKMGLESKNGIKMNAIYNCEITIELAQEVMDKTLIIRNSYNKNNTKENPEISNIIESYKTKTSIEYLNDFDKLSNNFNHQGKKIVSINEIDNNKLTRTEISKKIGISYSNIWKLKKIQKCKPELLNDIDSGLKTTHHCYQICKKNRVNDGVNDGVKNVNITDDVKIINSFKSTVINDNVVIVPKNEVHEFVMKNFNYTDKDLTFEEVYNEFVEIHKIAHLMSEFLKNEIYKKYIERKKFVEETILNFTNFISKKI